MNMILGIPVMDQKELTNQCIDSLIKTVKDPHNFVLAIIDNDSEKGWYRAEDYKAPFPVIVISNVTNVGYYYPLKQLSDTYHADLIGLAHNDLIFYEEGWDTRLKMYFMRDQKLGLVGFTGSNQVDIAGGRGGGTMCYFRGEKGQDQSAGRRITDLQPSILLDSLFMMFRKSAITDLEIDEHIAPCHFYDKIWSMRMVECGWRVATMGSEVDHMGGQTAVLVSKFIDDAKAWCEKEGIPLVNNDPRHTVYLEAERRFLDEYRTRKLMIPGYVDQNYNFIRQ